MRPIDHFDTAAAIYASRIALQDLKGATLSFEALRAVSERIANAVSRMITSDQMGRVAIYSPNDFRVVTCTLGIMRAGAVVVPIHVKDTVSHNIDYLRRIQPACVFFHSSVSDSAAIMKTTLGNEIQWVCMDASVNDCVSLDSFATDDRPYVDDWGDPYGNPDRPVYIRQTSGTTGTPKIVVGNVLSFDATQMVHHKKLRVTECGSVCLVAAPLSHAAGVHAFSMLTIGATLVVLSEFEPVAVLRAIQEHGVTHIWLPPSALYLLLSCPAIKAVDLSTLRSVVIGASAISPDKLLEAVRIFGPCININYSQIESGFVSWLDAPIIAAAVAGDHPERIRSSGQSLCVSMIAIMADNGSLVGSGIVGEIVVRGRAVKPFIVTPYLLDVDEITASGRFGWHHTGDLGLMDVDGYLYVIGRLKDNIIVGGFKVSAGEVETVIMEIQEVAECAVFAVPDAIRGEVVKAVVSVRPGCSVTTKAISSHCRERLSRLKCPSVIELRSDLPKTPVGKVDKLRIRNESITPGLAD